MDAVDDSRKQWASLLAGKDHLYPLALGNWLGLAASAFGTDPWPFASQTWQPSPESTAQDSATDPAPELPAAANWAAALSPIFNAWTEAFENVQGSAWSWLSRPADNPLTRVLSHPAAVGGSESSPGRLSLQAGLALVDFLQGTLSHQALQTQGWTKALQRFMGEFIETGDPEAKPVVVSSLDDIATHWASVGEAALQKHSRSEVFLQSQAEVLRKAMRYRIAHRRVVEAASRANDVPTLTDLDEAFASIHALRSEMRGVRRLAEAAASAAAAANASAAVSRAKSKAGVRRARSAA